MKVVCGFAFVAGSDGWETGVVIFSTTGVETCFPVTVVVFCVVGVETGWDVGVAEGNGICSTASLTAKKRRNGVILNESHWTITLVKTNKTSYSSLLFAFIFCTYFTECFLFTSWQCPGFLARKACFLHCTVPQLHAQMTMRLAECLTKKFALTSFSKVFFFTKEVTDVGSKWNTQYSHVTYSNLTLLLTEKHLS